MNGIRSHSVRMSQNGTGGSSTGTLSLYSTVLAKGAPTSADTQPSSGRMRLRRALVDLLARRPEGVPLSAARRSCSLLLDPQVLDGYASVRQLLESMPDVVALRGLGVQTVLLPAGSGL